MPPAAPSLPPPYHLILHTPVGLSLVGKVPKGPRHGQGVPPVLVEEDAGGKEGGREGGREGRREGGPGAEPGLRGRERSRGPWCLPYPLTTPSYRWMTTGALPSSSWKLTALMVPPAASTRSRSLANSGLWSKERGRAWSLQVLRREEGREGGREGGRRENRV